MALVHFKCMYDPTWDYASICKDFFGDGKCIAMAEKMTTNAHVHFQGECILSEDAFTKKMTELASTHFSKKEYPSGRPLKRVKRTVDETGYQYLCKEGHAPIYSQGFGDEELRLLKEKSDAHVQELKCGLMEHVSSRTFSGSPEQVHQAIKEAAWDYYKATARRPGPRFQKDVLYAMGMHPQATRAWELYVMDRI